MPLQCHVAALQLTSVHSTLSYLQLPWPPPRALIPSMNKRDNPDRELILSLVGSCLAQQPWLLCLKYFVEVPSLGLCSIHVHVSAQSPNHSPSSSPPLESSPSLGLVDRDELAKPGWGLARGQTFSSPCQAANRAVSTSRLKSYEVLRGWHGVVEPCSDSEMKALRCNVTHQHL